MKSFCLIVALGLLSSPAQSAPPAWPGDLKAALQGKWIAENNARSIQVSGDQVTFLTRSQFQDSYYGAPNTVMASIGQEDVSRASEHHRFFKGTCINAGTNFKPSPCTSFVNLPGPGKVLLLQINGDRYWREAEMSAWSKKHRLRTEP